MDRWLHTVFSPPCVCIVLRPLSLPQGTTCLNHILGKIIPEMKVLSGLPVHSVFKVQVLTLELDLVDVLKFVSLVSGTSV